MVYKLLKIIKILLQERNATAFAEGARSQETLRQKDCNNILNSGEKC